MQVMTAIRHRSHESSTYSRPNTLIVNRKQGMAELVARREPLVAPTWLDPRSCCYRISLPDLHLGRKACIW